MSTQPMDIEKDQESPRSLYKETVVEEKVSPKQTFPHRPQRPPKSNRWYVVGAVFVALVLILSLGAILIPGLVRHSGSQVTPEPTSAPTSPTSPVVTPTSTAPVSSVTATPGNSDITPTPAPGVNLGPQTGPAPVSDPAYWDKIIGCARRATTSIAIRTLPDAGMDCDESEIPELTNVRQV